VLRRRRPGRPIAPDTSPEYIRKIRRALCDEFIATGFINVDLQRRLREYAVKFGLEKNAGKC